MKRILLYLLCLLICISLSACQTDKDNVASNQSYAIDLEKCEIGYELPVYPNSDFTFQTAQGEIVEIFNFKVTLKEKNTIITKDPIDQNFMYNRFIIAVTFDGKVDPTLTGKKVRLALLEDSAMHAYNILSSETIVGEDGKFSFSGVCETNRYVYEVLFGYVNFY